MTKTTNNQQRTLFKTKPNKANFRKAYLKPSSLELYEGTAKRLLDFFGNDGWLRDITLERAEDFVLAQKNRTRGRQGNELSNWTREQVKHHVKKAKIEPDGQLAIHTLRKCAGKNWAMVNRDPSVTQKLMGQSSIATTMKYYDQVTDEDRARAAAAIDSLMAEAKQN